MSRKVFLSFLGNSIYKPTLYKAENQNEETIKSTRFIQEALIQHYCSDFSKGDKIFIFTTKEALHNWKDEIHFDSRSNENVVYDSLKQRLNKLELACTYENIEIPNGKSTEEIWDIFQIVYDLIEKGDELLFDITHGFRSLPMLNMVLINYAKLLRNITVSGIYYGNWEARYTKNTKTYSPIWNLTDFEELQEWTNSANIFLNTGNAIKLSKLIQDKENFAIKEGLTSFSKHILVNRGVDILKGDKIIALRDALKKVEDADLITKDKPLVPILNKIRHKFDGYKDNHPINGFIAVKWAINNGLIQQAATLLEESITTFILFEIGQSVAVQDKDKRTAASAALTIGDQVQFRYTDPESLDKSHPRYKDLKSRKEEVLKWEKEFVPKIRKLPFKKELSTSVAKIKNSIRDDINHAGFRENPRHYDGFVNSVIKRYEELQKLFLKLDKMNLPEIK